MKLRVPSLFFAVAFAALSAQAQNPGATVESLASDLAALTARVAKLQGQIVAADLVGAAKEDRSHGHGLGWIPEMQVAAPNVTFVAAKPDEVLAQAADADAILGVISPSCLAPPRSSSGSTSIARALRPTASRPSSTAT
jgi:hypothetical protein